MRRTANITKKDRPAPPAGIGEIRAEIRRLSTDNQKKSERIGMLRQALAPNDNGTHTCSLCRGMWHHGDPEAHTEGCIAAPYG